VILTFPYRLAKGVDPSPAAPDAPLFRPIIPVRFVGPHGRDALTLALVDTGADESVLPHYLARTLGVKLDSKYHALFAANGKPFLVRYGVVELQIARPGVGIYGWKAKVGFQEKRPDTVVGRAGCLDRLSVHFDGPNRQVIVTTPDIQDD
jgi:predicted aspartyl protease